MALATVLIKESNTVAQSVTPAGATSITNSNMGILDDSSQALVTAYAIPANTNSYEKWQRLKVEANASGNTIQVVKVWETGTLPTGDTHKVGTVQAAAFATPVRTASSIATTTIPATEGTAFPVPIGGTVTPTSNGVGMITTTGYSDYVVHQVHVDTATTSGPAAPLTMYWQYDEYA